VRRIKFIKEQELGYWEKKGYSNTADLGRKRDTARMTSYASILLQTY